MNKILKYGLIVITILTIVFIIAYGIFISTFDLFGEPEKTIIDTNCDFEGLRQATVYNFGGNATTVSSISVSIDLGCSNNPNDKDKKVVFSAEYKGGKVETAWLTFDTLKITYSPNLIPITQIKKVIYSDTSLNVNIVFVKSGAENNKEEVIYEEYLGKRLNPIRENIKEISGIKEWTSIDKRKIERKEHDGVGIYYFLKGKLKKIRLIQTNESSRIFSEFYLNNDSLFFVFERQIDSLEIKKDLEFYEPYEDSLFFEKGELIRVIANQDCGAPFSDEYLKSEQERLKTDFDLLIRRLKRE